MKRTAIITAIAWAIAALIVFPYFLPTLFTFKLFGPRLAMAALFGYLAYRAVKTIGASHVQPIGRTNANRGFMLAMAGLIASLYVNVNSYSLILPTNGHILGIIQTSLHEQGEHVTAEYTDIAVSDADCFAAGNREAEWYCSYNVSYKLASTDQTYTNNYEDIDVGPTGNRIRSDVDCEFNFQWSKRLRESPYYVNDLEPIKWYGCSSDETHFYNTISRFAGKREDHAIGLKVAKGATPGKTVLSLPSPDSASTIIKNSMSAAISKVTCEDVTKNPAAESVTCTVSGNGIVWQDNSLASVGLPQEIRGNFSKRVKIVPERLKWVLK